ncbi:MAG TPA: hypothetical protein VLD67_00095 [Vicinamibacterales bacterium]|nr:hypothetical protein [Vicinamibacterales bacterium]
MTGLILMTFLAASGSSEAGGQAAAIAGRWEVTSATSTRRNADGTVEVLATGTFTLLLTVAGEGVTATWSGPNGAPPDRMVRSALTGTWKAGKLDLTSDWFDTTVTSNGTPRTVKVRWVFHGAITNGQFGGTRSLEVQGRSREPLLIAWTAKRSQG